MRPTVKVRNIVIGEGRPKICVPLTETTADSLAAAAKDLKNVPLDLVEWRADYFEHLTNPDELRDALSMLRTVLGEVPILFTIRTLPEGGTIDISTETYLSCNLIAMETGAVDLIDAELSRGEEAVKSLVTAAEASGISVVGSRHDFSKTPAKEEIVASLCRMQQLGCRIAKYAVMPKNERDVLTLLDATLTMKEDHPETPVITMSMGKLGEISRIAGIPFGSALTFGTAGKASAPGQLPAPALEQFFDMLS